LSFVVASFEDRGVVVQEESLQVPSEDVVVVQDEDDEQEDLLLATSVDLVPHPIPDALELPPLQGNRRDRFPSVEERVKVYMSNWYLPSCRHQGKVKYKLLPVVDTDSADTELAVWIQEPRNLVGTINSTEYVVMSRVTSDKAFFLTRASLQECGRIAPNASQSKINLVMNLRALYCPDVAGTLLTALDHVLWEQQHGRDHDEDHDDDDDHIPIMMQFGDMRYSKVRVENMSPSSPTSSIADNHTCRFLSVMSVLFSLPIQVYRYMNAPLIKKFRSATTPSELRRMTATTTATGRPSCLEVRTKMQTAHNLPSLEPVVWKLSSKRHYGMLDSVYKVDTPWDRKKDMAVFRGQLTGSVDGYNRTKTAKKNCRNLRRCRFVYKHSGSDLVDALLTSTQGRIPNSINNVTLVGDQMSLKLLLQYKGIIMLEGNDVASGLKWALLSQSVVLMPVPRHTSWAMEELLEPWVHYIPLNDDAGDVEHKMKWVLENDEHARRIARRGSLWMQDLVFHPDSIEDDRLVQEEILRRYMAHFAPAVTPADNDADETTSLQ
jgi:hypothetical protein